MVFQIRFPWFSSIDNRSRVSSETFYTAQSDVHVDLNKNEYLNVRSSSLRVFTINELIKATHNFDKSTKIGEGGFGSVYKGVIKMLQPPFDDVLVAVKRGRTGHKGYRQWETEVNILGETIHPYLVKLIGYCYEQKENESNWLLVYEYMPNGSVADHLSSKAHKPLSWGQRLKIALDAAHGLTYLHEGMGAGRQIIFRDFKPSNVLLDEDWNAKLSDFGFAREGPQEGQTYVSDSVVGTKGYAAPEYVQTGRLTSKIDVWSYGIFLGELISGRRPLVQKSSKRNPESLGRICCYAGSGKSKLVIDRRLDGKFSKKSVQKLSSIADKCLVRDPKKRPKMSEVLQMVREALALENSQDLNVRSSNLMVFSLDDLKKATKNFDKSTKIGEDGFGSVYMGIIKRLQPPFDDIQVAVKWGRRGHRGYRQLETEVKILRELMHQNLVKLIGYCTDQNGNESNCLLVYEYMPNGSVDDHLTGTSQSPLSWRRRLKIALDAAYGLTYLHEGSGAGRQIIFRDFKPSNVLLDKDWNAKLSDFGFARQGPQDGRTHVSISIVGTKAYAAPEYFQNRHLTFKIDVWSYGIFLQELITGQRPLAQKNSNRNPECMGGICCYSGAGKSELVVDPRLEGKFNEKSIRKLSSIADKCLAKDPKNRPKMSQVLQMVTKAITLEDTQDQQSGHI